MATETWILITMLAASLILQLATMIATKRRIERLEGHTLSYRPWMKMGTGTRHKDQRDDGDPLDDEQDEHSPLNDVFQRYSLLTDRMADLVFQLTAQRSRQQQPNSPAPTPAPAAATDQALARAPAAATKPVTATAPLARDLAPPVPTLSSADTHDDA